MTEPPNEISDVDYRPPEPLNTEESIHKLPLTDIFELGIYLEFVRIITDRDSVIAKDVVPPLRETYEILQNSDIDSVVVDQVGSYHYKIIESHESSDEELSNELKNDIRVKSTTWKHLLARELGQENRIPVDDTGLLKIDSLIDNPEDLFGDIVWDWLDERPQSDIREACRCIVVGCSTASVMMSLRAVEHCLRKWYEEEHEELDATWGRVLDQLMEEYTEEEKRNDTVLTQLSDLPPVLSNLYYLKEKRNEVSHPDQSPNSQEARRTLMIVASTISEIHDELRDIAASEAEQNIEQTTSIHSLSDFEARSASEEDGVTEIILDSILRMERNNQGDPVPKSAIVDLGEHIDLSEEEIEEILTDLMMSGQMYEPADNAYKVI